MTARIRRCVGAWPLALWLAVLPIMHASAATDGRMGEPYFEAVDHDQAIPDGVVTVLAQDSTGFLWIGTPNGLLRYDGYRFRHYRHDADNGHSLVDDGIRSLAPMPDGTLWIGTQTGGISIYSPERDRFETLSHVEGASDGLAENAVLSLARDPRGGVWIGLATQGLQYRDPHNGRYQQFRHDPDNPQSLPRGAVRSLLVDRRGDLWIGTRGGLARRRANSGAIERVASTPDLPDSLFDQYVYALFESSDGRIWAGTQNNGAVVVDPESGRFQRIAAQPQAADGVSHPWISSLSEPVPEQVWLGTYGAGINVVDLRTLQVRQRLRHDPAEPSSLALDLPTFQLQDRSGLLWIGTWGGGLQRYNAAAQAFENLRYSPFRKDGPSHAHITSALSFEDGTLWLGTGGNGIDVRQPERGWQAGFRPDPNAPGALRDGTVRALARTADGTLWAGTQQAGLHRFLGPAQGFRQIPGASGGADERIGLLYPTRNGHLIVTSESGLAEFDPATEQARRLSLDGEVYFKSLVLGIAEDREGHLWLASSEGLLLRRAGSATMQWVRAPDGAPGALASSSVRDVALDGDGQVWVLGSAGLERLVGWVDGQPRFVRLVLSGDSNPLRNDTRLIADAQGRLWTERHVIDPAAPRSDEYGRADGVNFGNFSGTAIARLHDGRLLFGGTQGLALVTPAAFQPWSFAPTLAITDLQIDGKHQTHRAPPLTVTATQRSFGVEFAALDFSAPQRLRYRYRLDGYDDDWLEVDASARMASYSNLWPRAYTLRVQGSNRVGQWSPQELRLPINVRPAFWQTGWFAGVLVLALVALGYGGSRWRVRKLERDKTLLASHVAERTAALQLSSEQLREARDQAERERHAAELATRSKSEFLASMSHEIRTPMNAIIGFAHLGQQLAAPPAAHDYFNKIAGAGKNLLNVINDVLDFSKVEAGMLELETAEFDLDELLRQVEDLFVHQAEAKGIELVLAIGDQVPNRLLGDSLRLGQVLINLSNNALKFTEQGEVLLRVTREQDESERVQLRFAVKDSGIGIAPDKLGSLFEAFSQADAGTARRFGGSGLGLAISQRLVHLMGGAFDVTSTPGLGSEFAFSAWFGKAVADARAPSLHERLGDLRVLVVDDNALVREALQQQLTTFGLQADTADCATAAYRAIEQAHAQGQPFGLVLIDWQMPGIDGLQASAHILARQQEPEVTPATIIMVTAHRSEDLRQRALDAGIRGVLGKPVSPSLLFNVVLQACDALAMPGNAARAVATPALPTVLQGKRVLVVEDNPINQQVATEILRLAGVVATVADGGEQALQRAAEQAFDAILMDVHMPGMDGLEATRRLRAMATTRAVPIIAMTADALKGYREDCLAAGMDDALTKPIEPDRLFATLARWITGEAASLDIPDVTEPDDARPLPVLDSRRAIARLAGNKELYLRLLGDFLRDWRTLPAQLDALLAQGATEQAARLAHSYKGVAGHVGAAVTERDAGRLDRCLRRGEVTELHDAMAGLRRSHAEVLAAGEALRPPAPAKPLASSPGLRIDVDPLLRELLQRVQRFDPSAEALLPMLRTALGRTPPEELATLEAQVGAYDFRNARATLEAWLASRHG